jgi:hypothetical protein
VNTAGPAGAVTTGAAATGTSPLSPAPQPAPAAAPGGAVQPGAAGLPTTAPAPTPQPPRVPLTVGDLAQGKSAAGRRQGQDGRDAHLGLADREQISQAHAQGHLRRCTLRLRRAERPASQDLRRCRHRTGKDGKVDVKIKREIKPGVSHVDVWNLFPDPAAAKTSTTASICSNATTCRTPRCSRSRSCPATSLADRCGAEGRSRSFHQRQLASATRASATAMKPRAAASSGTTTAL